MKKYIILTLLLFSLYSCGNTDIVSNTKNNEINLKEKQKNIFSEIKDIKEGDKIILSGKTDGEVNKIEIFWKNGNQNDSYFLKKFKKGDKKWLTNLKVDYGNLLDGNNEYIIKLYKNNKVYKEITKIIKHKIECTFVLNNYKEGINYKITTKNTYNCEKYGNFKFIGLKGYRGNIAFKNKWDKQKNTEYIKDSTKEEQLMKAQRIEKELNNTKILPGQGHASFSIGYTKDYNIKYLNNKYCKDKTYCFIERTINHFDNVNNIEISLNDLIIKLESGDYYNKDETKFSLLKESFEKMKIEKVDNFDIYNIESIEFGHNPQEFILYDKKNYLKKIILKYDSKIKNEDIEFAGVNIFLVKIENGKIHWVGIEEWNKYERIGIKKNFITDLKGNTFLIDKKEGNLDDMYKKSNKFTQITFYNK